MKKNCNLVRDLLPLYAENMCSEESRSIVAEHINGCKECRNMLEKMDTPVEVSVDKDISAIRKIKKKIIVKRVIAVVAALVLADALFAGLIWLGMSPVSLGYDEFNLSDNLQVEMDSEGVLWLGKANQANVSDIIYPCLKDSNGRFFPDDKDYDKDKKEALGITLKMPRYKNIEVFAAHTNNWEYTKILDTKASPDIEYVFYYDDETGTEYKIWEKTN